MAKKGSERARRDRATAALVGSVRAGATMLRAGVTAGARSLAGAAVTAFAEPPPPRPWPLRTRGRWTGRPRDLVWLLDAVAMIAVVTATAAAYTDRNEALGEVVGPGAVFLASLATGVPLLLRDRWPIAAWRLSGAVTLFSAAWASALFEQVPLFPTHVLVLVITTYTAVVRADRAIAFGVWVLTMAGVAYLPVPMDTAADDLDSEAWVALVLLMSVPVVLGHNVRARRLSQVALVDERRRGEVVRAEHAVLEERARIARELHDVVAHHMTLIAIQAEAGPLRHPGDAQALEDELRSIRADALTALTETRRILGVLRADTGTGVEPPAPGLDDLARLADAARGAGHPVTLDVDVTDVDVSPGTALSVHRIVQESLSNVRQHAPGAAVTVTVHQQSGPPPTLRVEVANGPGTREPIAATAASGGGHGLVGMRERVAMLDGHLQAGTTADGGYAVHVTLPGGRA